MLRNVWPADVVYRYNMLEFIVILVYNARCYKSTQQFLLNIIIVVLKPLENKMIL